MLLALVFPAAASAHTDAGWQLSLHWPADGTITSPFGQEGSRWHPGLDIGILGHSMSVPQRTESSRVSATSTDTRDTAAWSSSNIAPASRRCTRICRYTSRIRVNPCAREKSLGPQAARAGARVRTSISSCATTTFRWIHPSSSWARLARPRAVSSVGRAPARQAGGHWFEPSTAHSDKSPVNGRCPFAALAARRSSDAQ